MTHSPRKLFDLVRRRLGLGREKTGVTRTSVKRANLNLETLENRLTPATGISLNSVTGALMIEGTDAYNESSSVRNMTINGVLKVYVSLSSKNAAGQVVQSQSQMFDAAIVKSVTFYGYAGNDTFSNYTGLASSAWGGAGNDCFYGGKGVDTFYGEGGVDTLKGNAGNDYLNGGADMDALYGGLGVDTLVAGDTGTNYLYQD